MTAPTTLRKRNTMNRYTLRGSLILAAGLGIGSVALAIPAHADAPGTITVAWAVKSDDFSNRFAVPQTYPAPACGKRQVDVYRYDDTIITTPSGEQMTAHDYVDQILAGGSLPSAAVDAPVYISNTDEDLGPCDTTPTPAPTGSPTSSPAPTPTETATLPASPTPSAVSSASPSSTATTAARTSGSVATVSPTATATAATAVDQLAFTGSLPTWPFYLLGGGLVTAGAVLVATSPRRKIGADS